MEKIKVSIIVPLFNKEKYIEKNINSLINQTFENFEIIIIDDGSKDKSYEKIKKFLKNKKIIYKKIKNSGVSIARNEGIDLARGKYLIFIDADDFIELDMIERLYREIEMSQSDMIICGMSELINDKVSKVFELSNRILEIQKKKSEKILEIPPTVFHSCGNKLFRKEILEKNKIKFLENSHSYEDLNFVLKYLIFTKKIQLVKESYYYYFRNQESVTKKRQVYKTLKELYLKLLETYDSFDDINKYLIKNENKMVREIVDKKIKEFSLYKSGIKSMQNLYIKDLSVKNKEVKFYSNKLYYKYEALQKIKENAFKLKIRYICFRVFRLPLNFIYNLKEK